MSNDKLAQALREYFDASEAFQMTLGHPEATAQDEYAAEQRYAKATREAREAIAANEAEKQAGPVALGYMNAGHLHEMQQGRLPYGYVYAEEGPGAHVAVFLAPPSESDKEDAELTDEQIDAAALAETGFDGVGTQEMNAFDIRRIVRAARAKKGQP